MGHSTRLGGTNRHVLGHCGGTFDPQLLQFEKPGVKTGVSTALLGGSTSLGIGFEKERLLPRRWLSASALCRRWMMDFHTPPHPPKSR